jgi:hypothetical protein
MKHRFIAVLAVFALTLTTTGSAWAFDCMRVSSSMQGLQQSATKSGNWLFFDMTPGGGGVAEAATFIFGSVTGPQVDCLQAQYTAAASAPDSVLPMFWALGFGVAGGKTGNGPGVLAHNNPNSNVLSNGTGIDHFDDTILPYFVNVAGPACGLV